MTYLTHHKKKISLVLLLLSQLDHSINVHLPQSVPALCHLFLLILEYSFNRLRVYLVVMILGMMEKREWKIWEKMGESGFWLGGGGGGGEKISRSQLFFLQTHQKLISLKLRENGGVCSGKYFPSLNNQQLTTSFFVFFFVFCFVCFFYYHYSMVFFFFILSFVSDPLACGFFFFLNWSVYTQFF